VRSAEEVRKLGFTAVYGYARDITEPSTIIDILGQAAGRLP
jgi:hypothetical protein